MIVDFPPEIEERIQEEVASGRFSSASDVLVDAMKIWSQKELREEIQKGLDDLDRGDYEEYDEESLGKLFDEIRAARPKAGA